MICILIQTDKIDSVFGAKKARKRIDLSNGMTLLVFTEKSVYNLNLNDLENVTVISEQKADRFIEANLNYVIHNEKKENEKI